MKAVKRGDEVAEYIGHMARSVSSLDDVMVARKSAPLKGEKVTVTVRHAVRKEMKKEMAETSAPVAQLKTVMMASMSSE